MTHKIIFHDKRRNHTFYINEATASIIRHRNHTTATWMAFTALDGKQHIVNLKFIHMITIEEGNAANEMRAEIMNRGIVK